MKYNIEVHEKQCKELEEDKPHVCEICKKKRFKTHGQNKANKLIYTGEMLYQ